MKRAYVLPFIIGLGFFLMMSMTIDQGANDYRISRTSGVSLNVPAKPSSTVYIQGVTKMNQYLKKGYQVQEITGGGNPDPTWQYFLMVKY
jgi:hypothetical protein